MIGSQLLHYQVEAHLGTGGMGEVYRARDTRLGREVAIKVLPELVAMDPDRVARFEREARLLASLNHSNIAALHGLESSDTRLFLVMELVEGQTLAERIRHGPLPVDEALTYARQIADALEAAHEKGVIHRDLKPANVKITPEGKVKVLDFGLAKALDAGGAGTGALGATHSPTLSLAATYAGVILGTAAYMSPEQAKGAAVDQRSDLFSFGCVLYEMLTGRQPFQGDSVTEVIASVLKSEADLALLPARLNPKLVELIRRCLAKDPKRRWHAAADVRMEIEAILSDPHGLKSHPEAASPPRAAWKRVAAFAATAVGAAALAAGVTWYVRPAPPPATVTRFSILLPGDQQLTRLGRHNIAVSPDGQQIVYVANRQLYLRGMGDLEARPVQGTNQDINTPFFSPDGQWIGFYVVPEGKLKKVAVTGGASVTIADVENPYGASWGPDDQILIGQGSGGIARVSANGGMPETVIEIESGDLAHGPQLLPDGDHVLFTLARGTGATRWDQAQVVVQSLRTGARRVAVSGGSDARYVPTGHVIYGLGTNLLAVPFDHRSLTVTGGPVPAIESIARSSAVLTAAMFFSVSQNGALAYFVGEGVAAATNLTVAFVDRTGASVPLSMPAQPYTQPRISPDGRQLAVVILSENESNIWISNLTGAMAPRRLTFGGGSNISPTWTPDGRRIVFVSNRDGDANAIYWQPADGSGTAERLTDPKVVQPTQVYASTRSTQVLFQHSGDIWTLSLDGDRKPQLLVDSPRVQEDPALSPDGRWIAYSSGESTQTDIYVQPFPPTGAKYQITTIGAHDPRWSPDGRQLFYLQDPDHALMSVDVRTDPGFAVGNPTALVQSVRDDADGLAYDVTPDGRRFAVIAGPGNANQEAAIRPEIRVTLNWFEELRQRVPR